MGGDSMGRAAYPNSLAGENQGKIGFLQNLRKTERAFVRFR
jgi:hypothetical protein